MRGADGGNEGKGQNGVQLLLTGKRVLKTKCHLHCVEG